MPYRACGKRLSICRRAFELRRLFGIYLIYKTLHPHRRDDGGKPFYLPFFLKYNAKTIQSAIAAANGTAYINATLGGALAPSYLAAHSREHHAYATSAQAACERISTTIIKLTYAFFKISPPLHIKTEIARNSRV